MMSEVNLAKLNLAISRGRRVVGAIYKRTRRDEAGRKVQRAELRFDDVAGCLRTPAGGSSRQVVLFVEGRTIRSRLISARETARQMGLPDDYLLPESYNEAYHLTGDGVAVPVVRHIAQHLFEPILLRRADAATIPLCNGIEGTPPSHTSKVVRPCGRSDLARTRYEACTATEPLPAPESIAD